MAAWLFALVGLATGLAHAVWLGRQGRRPRAWTWPARFLGVGAVFLVAALAGWLLATAAGWAVGFLAAAVVTWRRLA
ncbi:MAG TPA: hypothetical protein VFN73_05660 [Propionibacteriaceae bacterium]|nr:hypothetical protein [Propionibacteriaceae bacterium]